jgi:hypothetical protein
MRDAFPPSVIPAFWELLAEGIESGHIISNEMVLMEIEKQDDDLTAWCKEHSKLFIPMNQGIVDRAETVVKRFPNMMNPYKEKDFADPFLIAQADLLKAVIVTQEGRNGPQHPKSKIGDVCDGLNVRTIKMIQMVKELRWEFTRK